MKTIRKIVGAIILFINSMTRPRPVQRSQEDQKNVDRLTEGLSLYQFNACPFCVKVRRTLHKLNLNVQLRDAKDEAISNELLKEGGKRKVPCLRITQDGSVRWLYNSKDIISYVQSAFAVK